MSDFPSGSSHSLLAEYPELTEDDLAWSRECFGVNPHGCIIYSFAEGVQEKLRTFIEPDDEDEALTEDTTQTFLPVMEALAREEKLDVFELFAKQHINSSFSHGQQVNLWAWMALDEVSREIKYPDYEDNLHFLFARFVALTKQYNMQIGHAQIFILRNYPETGDIKFDALNVTPANLTGDGQNLH